MRSFWTTPVIPLQGRLYPALAGLAGQCRGILPGLLAYVGTLALLAVGGIHFLNQLQSALPNEPAARPGWSPATRSYPAFAISQSDMLDKTESYEILRHPQGGRKDIFRWADRDQRPGERPIAELEIYRPGGEFNPTAPALTELAAGIDPEGDTRLESAGFLDSKFGLVRLMRQTGSAANGPSCLGFIRAFDQPRLRIQGWSCGGGNLPVQRTAIGCMLNRLILLSAGNDPRLAELFARAELRRGDCGPAAPSATSADWLTTAQNPGLRGAF
jgi:hypothetical protein